MNILRRNLGGDIFFFFNFFLFMEKPRLLHCNSCSVNGQITTISIGPKTGLVYATGSTDNMLNLFSMGNSEPLVQFGPLKSCPTSCIFGESEEIIACGNNGGTAILYDISNHKTLGQWSVCQSSINSIVFDPSNPSSIACATNDGKVQIVAQNCQQVVTSFLMSQKPIKSIAFSPDGLYIAAGGEDKVLNIYDMRIGKILAYHEQHKGTINSVAWNDEGNMVMSGGSDRAIKFFNIDTFRGLDLDFRLNPSEVKSVAFFNKANAALAVSSSLLNIVCYDPVQEYDRFKYPSQIGTVFDTRIFQQDKNNNILIATAKRGEATISRIKSKTLSPFSPYGKQPVQPQAVNHNASPSSSVDIERRRSSEGPPSSYTNEGKIYNEYRKDRGPFLTQMTERSSKITRLGEMIANSGLEQTIEYVGESGDLQLELAKIIMRRPKAIKLQSAASLMNIASKLFEVDQVVALSLIDAVLASQGKVTFATMRTNSDTEQFQQRKVWCQEMIDAFKNNIPSIQRIARNKGPLRSLANDMLIQWRSFC